MGAHVWSPAYMRDHLLPSGRVSGWTHGLVRRLPGHAVLHGAPDAGDRGAELRRALRRGLQAGHHQRGRHPAGLRLPVRSADPPALPGAGAAVGRGRACSCSTARSRSTAATPRRRSPASSPSPSACRWRSSTSGIVGRGLADGTHRALAAAVLAACGLCHVIPLFFAIGGTVVWFLVYLGRDVLEMAGSLADDRRTPAGGRHPGPSVVAAHRRRRWPASWSPSGCCPSTPSPTTSTTWAGSGSRSFDDFLFWREDLSGGGLIDYPTLALVLALALAGAAISVAAAQPGGRGAHRVRARGRPGVRATCPRVGSGTPACSASTT